MPETPRGKLKPAKEHFLAAGAMLMPEQSQYDYLANLPEGVGICEALNTAMRLIEEEYAGLAGILPKNYPGQLLTFTAIMNAYRGDPQAISDAAKQLQAQAIEQAINLAEAINALRKQYADSIANNPALDFSEAQVELAQRLSIADDADYTACHALLSRFENPAATLTGLLEGCKTQLDAAKKALDKKDSAGKKQLDEQGKLLRELNGAINAYQNQYTKSQVGEPLQDNLVMKYWTEYMDELKQRIGKAEDQQEELKLKHHLKRVEETEVCIVVSSEQNEIQKLAKLGLTLRNIARKWWSEIWKRSLRTKIILFVWLSSAQCGSPVLMCRPYRRSILISPLKDICWYKPSPALTGFMTMKRKIALLSITVMSIKIYRKPTPFTANDVFHFVYRILRTCKERMRRKRETLDLFCLTSFNQVVWYAAVQ